MRQTTNISNKLINESKTNNNQPLSGNSTHRWHASSTSINLHNHDRQMLHLQVKTLSDNFCVDLRTRALFVLVHDQPIFKENLAKQHSDA